MSRSLELAVQPDTLLTVVFRVDGPTPQISTSPPARRLQTVPSTAPAHLALFDEEPTWEDAEWR